MNVDAETISVSFGLDAVPASGLATYLSTVPPGLPATLGYVPQDAFVVGALRIGDTGPLTEWALGFQTKLLTAMGGKPEKIERITALTRKFMNMKAEEATFAMLPGFKLSFVHVERYRDATGIAEMQRQRMELNRQLMSMYRMPGMEMTFDVDPMRLTYKGHDISKGAFVFGAKPVADAEPLQAQMLEAQQKAITAIYGERMSYHATAIGSDWVTTAGEGSLDTMKELIDGSYKKLRDVEGFSQAVKAIDPNASGVIFLRLTDVVHMWMEIMREIVPRAPFPSVTFQQGPGIAASVIVSARRADCNMKIPAAEIRAVVEAFMPQKPPQPVGGP